MVKELVRLVKSDGSKAEAKDLNPVDVNAKADAEEAKETQVQEKLPSSYSYNPFKEAALEALLRRSKATVKVPYGKKAADKVLKHLQAFLQEQYYGVYRGECILAVADYFLEYKLDVDSAASWYEKSAKWLDTVKDFDNKIALFDIPEKIKNISSPPDSRYNYDSWGNIMVSASSTGNINNRHRSSWYLDNLQYRTNLALGIIAYANGDFVKANRLFFDLRNYDDRCRKEEKEIWGSTAQRLAAATKDKFGPRAENEYLVVFNGKKRLAAMFGNFSYDALDFKKSESFYQQLLANKFGNLSKEEEAYSVYLLGNIKHMQGKEKEAVKCLGVFESNKYMKTNIYAKAIYTLCAIAVQCRMDAPVFEEMWKRCFPLLLKRCAKTVYAEKGLFGYAFVMERVNNVRARNLYRKYLKHYPAGKYVQIVKEHLKESHTGKDD